MCIRDSPNSVHIATQHATVRDERRVTEWDRFGPAFSRRLPEHIPVSYTHLVPEQWSVVSRKEKKLKKTVHQAPTTPVKSATKEKKKKN